LNGRTGIKIPEENRFLKRFSSFCHNFVKIFKNI